MRILLVGESAAGHLAPIIAVYEEINKKKKELNLNSLEFMLISSESHFLKEMLEGVDLPYKTIRSAKRRSTSPLQPILDFFNMIIGFFQSLFFIFDYMPDIVFSKGGKVSLPIVMVSWIFRIPVIIHESDSVADPTNKFMFKFAKKVAVSFKDSKDIYQSPKVFFSGNPVRSFITEANREKAIDDFVLDREKPTILIMGGSEGAMEINNLVIEILPELLENYQIIHQCGVGNYNNVKSVIENMNIPNLNNYHLFPFFKKRIADAYVACDIVVSRAGANTVSEILSVDKPSILIPLASAVSDKQQKNAFHYSQSGAAVLLSEKNLKPHLLLNVINEIFQSSLKIMEMQRAARQLAQPEAAKKIAEQIIDIAK
ncbi:MAG: UDP-N-acetylglucosamine--N-acetylmuramyl-(pentapeptide) pyrophosphoryl-undecaprenol N-acetylglucosamine transferase [Candidatus Pacebacteria bacterium]|nr:UDP-N-acetylglucosamine--N-acetylmuramyl-(pentapeptide) pyrophosphoryl-undecaprenol N-acetylglucosamine transferase [Candidatus Paceibacterota bacterium]